VLTNTDELDSDVDSDEDAVTAGPKFCKFRPEDMNKEFKFQLGMEFDSLKDFKQALMEHSVLNGKEFKFVKNDQKREKVVCKKKCGFLIMVNMVGGRQTFKVKTLVGHHKYGRVFGNKNANPFVVQPYEPIILIVLPYRLLVCSKHPSLPHSDHGTHTITILWTPRPIAADGNITVSCPSCIRRM